MDRASIEKLKRNQTGEIAFETLLYRRTWFALLWLFVLFFVPISIGAENIRLHRGFNLFSYPVEPSVDLNCVDLQSRLGADQLSRLDVESQLFEDCADLQTEFPIHPGTGYVVNLPIAGSFDFEGEASCPSLDLVEGINLIGVPTPPQGVGCFDLLRAIGGPEAVATIQRFDSTDGRYQSCAYDHLGLSDTPLGTDFPVIPGEAYWVSMLRARQGVFLNDESQCEIIIDPPVISGFDPKSGSVGSLVTLRGNHFSPKPDLVPKVTMAKQGGGTIATPIARFNNTEIQITVPTSADSGRFTVMVGEQSAVSDEAFTVEPSSTFELVAEPTSADVIQGQSVSYSIALESNNGFSQLAKLSIEGLPDGITALFEPELIGAGQRSLLTLTAAENQPLGSSNFRVTVTAEVDGIDLIDSVGLTVTVQPVTTTFMGRAVVSDTLQTPLEGVTVTLLGRDGNDKETNCSGETTTDEAGNFSFTNLPAACTGDQLIRYDGLTVTNQPGEYAGVDLLYNIEDGQVTESPVLIHLPRIDDKETVMVKQDYEFDQTFTFESIPNLEVTVYAGTVLTLRDGSEPDPFPLIAIDVPIDRLPDEMSPSDTVFEPFIVAFQPANATASQPVAVSFPNLINTPPGTNVELSTLDPTQGVMVVYGTGTVSEDGTKVIPDFDPANPGKRYGLVHFDWHGSRMPEFPDGNPENPSPDCGNNTPSTPNPVDLSSGIEVIRETDIASNGLRGNILIQRIYRTMSVQDGPFGIGSGHNYFYRLDSNTPQTETQINLVMPDGTRFPYTLNASGTYTNSNICKLRGSVLTVASSGEAHLRWKNGTTYHFIPGTTEQGSMLSMVTDSNGNETTLTRNPANAVQIMKIMDPVGRSLSLTYDGNDRITLITDLIGRRVKYTYNALGTLETVTDPMGGMTTYIYSAADRLTHVTDARGITIVQNEYDANGRVIQQTHADGGVLTIAYTLANPSMGDGSPVLEATVTDPRPTKPTTTYRFNPLGYLLDATDAFGQVREFEREPGTNLLLAIRGPGQCEVCGDPAARDISFTYDASGNLLTRTDALNNTTTFTYDPIFNKLTSIVDPPPLSHETTFTYDASGNLSTVTDGRTNTTAFSYDSNGLLLTITDPSLASWSFDYDSAGNLTTITDPLTNVTEIQYDLVSRPIQIVDALENQTILNYDVLNRITDFTDVRGKTAQVTYDEISNLLSVTDARNNTTSFTYDPVGRLETRTDSRGNVDAREYDGNDNLTEFVDRRGQVSRFTYDDLDRLVAEAYDDSDVSRDYDLNSRLIQAFDSASGVFTMAYNLAGRLLNSSGPNGSVTYTRDVRGRVSRRQVVGQDPVEYIYDAAGNQESVASPAASVTYVYDNRNQVSHQARSNGVNTDYTYDPLGRVLTLIHSNGPTVLDGQSYIYDAVGNIIQKTVDVAQPLTTQPSLNSYDALSNRLTRWGTRTYTYDDNGSRLTETGPTGTTTYGWDTRNRLQTLTQPTGEIKTFRYDFVGNLIEEAVSGPVPSSSRTYVLDDLTNIAQLTNNPGQQLSILTGQTIDQHLAVTDSLGSSTYGVTDQINSTTQIIDDVGASKGQLLYEPFGETSSAGVSYPFAYTGRTPVTQELYYYRARFYDTQARRFVSEDPIGFWEGINLYSYVQNNPMNFRDPIGMKKIPVWVRVCFAGICIWKEVLIEVPEPDPPPPPPPIEGPKNPGSTPFCPIPPGIPGVGIPGVGVPGVGVPGVGIPGVGIPGVGIPGVGIPGVGVPGVGIPGIGVPGIIP